MTSYRDTTAQTRDAEVSPAAGRPGLVWQKARSRGAKSRLPTPKLPEKNRRWQLRLAAG